MIKIDHTEVVGWEAAIRGMRNPMNSWEHSDSHYDERYCYECGYADFLVGKDDISLMQKLCKAGSDHRKFMRMLVVYCDITAPLYWLKEFDTYKVGTVANSCSTMHKIHCQEFKLKDFSFDHLMSPFDTEPHEEYVYGDEGFPWTSVAALNNTINILNHFRELYLKTKDKKYWWQMIQLLPTSYNQKRTVMLNYEVLKNIYHARRNHKLDEWRDFCKWIESLPYSELITRKDDKDG